MQEQRDEKQQATSVDMSRLKLTGRTTYTAKSAETREEVRVIVYLCRRAIVHLKIVSLRSGTLLDTLRAFYNVSVERLLHCVRLQSAGRGVLAPHPSMSDRCISASFFAWKFSQRLLRLCGFSLTSAATKLRVFRKIRIVSSAASAPKHNSPQLHVAPSRQVLTGASICRTHHLPFTTGT